MPGGDHARFQGDGDLAVLIRGVRITSMHGFINNDWAAGCALGMRGTHSYRTGYDTLMIGFPTCDVSDVAIQPTRSHDGILPPEARAPRPAIGRRRALSPSRRGERALILQVEGKGGAPKLTLADPKGRIYTPTTTVNKVVPGRQLRERLPARRQRHAAARPAPARGHVDADAGRRLARDRQRALGRRRCRRCTSPRASRAAAAAAS